MKNPQKPLWDLGISSVHLFCTDTLVAGMGFEPHDLRVMSPTSYQAALPRDIESSKKIKTRHGAGDRGRTGTRGKSHGILSPGRLPIPPHRHYQSAGKSIARTGGFVKGFLKIF